jgi:hypothetical protein
MFTQFSSSAEILNDPDILASLEARARALGVPSDQVDAVVAETQRTAFGALARAADGVTPFGTDFGEMTDARDTEADLHPPETTVAFVCWVHVLLSRKAVRRTRTAWKRAWYERPVPTTASPRVRGEVEPAMSWSTDVQLPGEAALGRPAGEESSMGDEEEGRLLNAVTNGAVLALLALFLLVAGRVG